MAMLLLRESNGCWIDLYGHRRFRGGSRRLYGAADFPLLRIQERGERSHAKSVRVGPGAYVQCFAEREFHDTVFWLLPNEEVPDVAKLHVAETVDSLRLWDRPPFAYEPGYAAYMLWAASHVARMKE